MISTETKKKYADQKESIKIIKIEFFEECVGLLGFFPFLYR